MIAEAGADIILLDNMAPAEVEQTLVLLKEKGVRDKVVIEVSGGITGENLASYAPLAIDRISMGSLTHSITNADFSLDIMKQA